MRTLARPRDKAEIVQRLRAVRADHAARWGRMSAHQMVCHLSDSLLMATGRRPVSDASTLARRTLVKWIALYLPLRWPVGIETRPEVDQERGGTRPAAFAADVAQLEALLERFTAETKGLSWPAHPFFGAMSEAAWMRWGYLHADHHLRQFGA
jgi:hypothetical protein